MSEARGLRQKTTGGTWYVRRIVPDDVQSRIGQGAWNVSTKTTDVRVARQERDRLWLAWSAEIEEARALGTGPVADLPAVLVAVDNWRRAKCAAAADFAHEVEEARAVVFRAEVRALIAEVRQGPIQASVDFDRAGDDDQPIREGTLAWARAYFDSPRGREAEREPGRPLVTSVLLGRLQEAQRDSMAWVRVHHFDEAFDAAVEVGGLVSAIPSRVRDEARQPFARAWLEVVQHEEAERRRAATILATLEAASAVPAAIRVEASHGPVYTPREGDRTVGEVISEFKAASDHPALEKQYGHVFRALNEIVGADKPIRAFGRADVRAVHRVLAMLPANATKIYPGLPLAEAAERAAQEDRKIMAPNTVRSYLIALKSVCGFAIEEGWLDDNPVAGQIPPKADAVERRGLAKPELELVFGALQEDRRADSARFWVPAVLTFTGARANEICALHVDDIKEAQGVPYIDLTKFDADGRKLERRRLKTEPSARCVPIHSRLVEAGFLEFVRRRRDAGEERLFPDLRKNSLGYFSHELSKFFGRHLDSVGLTEPALCMHSLRHGFKDGGDEVRLPEYILEALGGVGYRRKISHAEVWRPLLRCTGFREFRSLRTDNLEGIQLWAAS